MFSEEREQKLKERLLAAFELARTAKLKPKVPEAQKSKSWFSGLIDHKVELVYALVNYTNCRWRTIHRYSLRISRYGIPIMYLRMYFPR
jgi:hypothetical protein